MDHGRSADYCIGMGNIRVNPEAVDFYRVGKGWTQAELAQAAGIGLSTLRDILKGRAAGSPATVKKIADALEVKGTEILVMEKATA